MPVITSTSGKPNLENGSSGGYTAKQIWYADDAVGGGRISDLRKWWQDLCTKGPMFGNFPKPSKTWVIVKPEHEEEAKRAFPNLKVTSIGQRYLGSFIGTNEGMLDFVEEKVNEWYTGAPI